MVDYEQIGTGILIIGAGLATPIPLIDDTIGFLIGFPMILGGLGQEDAADEVREKV